MGLHAKMSHTARGAMKNDVRQASHFAIGTENLPAKVKLAHLRNIGHCFHQFTSPHPPQGKYKGLPLQWNEDTPQANPSSIVEAIPCTCGGAYLSSISPYGVPFCAGTAKPFWFAVLTSVVSQRQPLLAVVDPDH